MDTLIAAAPADVYGTLEWLVQVRIVLILGWSILAAWLVIDNVAWLDAKLRARTKKTTKGSFELCKLHSRPVGTCPPGSHDDG